MIIWILALVLLASLAALGYRQGVVRVVFSFAGIILGALLAAPLGEFLKPLMARAGIQTPFFLWVLAPLEAFVLVLILFKIAGTFAHRKVEVHYRYRADDLKFALWERLNRRLGLCLGVLNGTAYLVLFSFLIFNCSYWTAQIASSDNQTWKVRLINRLGRDLATTGMNKAARAVITLPQSYYQTADVAGLLCQNPRLGSRLTHYPALLSLFERNDLKTLENDNTFLAAVQGSEPIGQLMQDDLVRGILRNTGLIENIRSILQTNFDDLTVFLKTGQSSVFDPEKILGYWDFNAVTTAAMLSLTQAKASAGEMTRQREFARRWMMNYLHTTLIVAPDRQAFLHNVPHLKSPSLGETATLHLWPIIIYAQRNGTSPGVDFQDLAGQWDKAGSDYTLFFNSSGKQDSLKTQTRNDRLTIITTDGDTLVFDRED